MEQDSVERKLAAILYADVAGYSRLTRADEEGTHRLLSTYLDAITDLIEQHHGEVLHYAGDAVLAEFASVVNALSCALAIQHDLKARNEELPDDRKLQFRIGINLGDVIVDRNEIYGDGVNVAARLESLAEPGGICISDMVRQGVEGKLDLDFEDLGEQQVKNIDQPVRAYSAKLKPGAVLPPAPSVRAKTRRPMRHVIAATAAAAVLVIGAGVITWLAPWAPTIEPASEEQMAFPLPEQPSIAVLPFDNLSADPAQEAIADGFTESLITTLAQMPELFVIARNSTFTYKGKPVKVKQVAEELGVRYVLEGSIQREGDTLRIAAQLIDAVKGHHLWADSYDRNVNAIFAVQDEITREIFTALHVKLVMGEHGRVQQKGTKNFGAYLKWLEGWRHFRRQTKDDMQLARKLILEAIDMDPDWAMPYTTVTWTHRVDITRGWSDSPAESLRLAEEFAQKALALDDTYPGVFAALGAVHEAKNEIDQAIADHEKAVALGPNISVYHAMLAYNLDSAGRAEEAVALLKKAMRLEPTYQPWYLGSLGDAYTSLGRHEEAIAAYKQYLKRRPESESGHAGLIVNHMWLDRQNEARSYASKLLESKPKFTLSSYRKRLKYKDAAYVERLLDALRKAGLPDKPPLALPDKPSIAVLPFANLSDDPKQEYFADGMTDDLITDLSKLSALFVIARNSTFAYKGKSPDVRQVARELGVKYVLEGSVRRAGEQVRINAQLIDATTGGHVWAERYDGSLDNVFAMQDEVTQKIVTALAVSLTSEEKASRTRIETKNPKAYDAFLQGWEHYRRGTPDDYAKAVSYFEQAINWDPNYNRARSALAAVYWNSVWSGWYKSLGLTYTQAMEQTMLSLEKAVEAPSALTHQVASERAAFLRRQPDKALTEAGHAIALDANDPAGHLAMATALIKAGKPAEAVERVRTAMRLDPHYPASYLTRLAQAQFLMGQFEDAAATLERAASRNPNDDWTFVYLAAAYGQLGREAEAKTAVEKANVLRAQEGWSTLTLLTIRQQVFKWAGDRKPLREGLRKAGVESGSEWAALVTTGPSGYEIKGATSVDVATAKELHDRGVAFIDVYHLWPRGHIPGADYLRASFGTYYPVFEFNEVRLLEIVDKRQEIVIYSSSSGGDERDAANASAQAITWGFQKVYYFADGFQEWKAAGYPVEKGG